jgi:hypothetical protein
MILLKIKAEITFTAPGLESFWRIFTKYVLLFKPYLLLLSRRLDGRLGSHWLNRRHRLTLYKQQKSLKGNVFKWIE